MVFDRTGRRGGRGRGAGDRETETLRCRVGEERTGYGVRWQTTDVFKGSWGPPVGRCFVVVFGRRQLEEGGEKKRPS